jgi:hypothetical protein
MNQGRVANFFAALGVDCTYMDIEIIKQVSRDFQRLTVVPNIGDMLVDGEELNILNESFSAYFTGFNQYSIPIKTLSQYYEMVLMVLVQCDANQKYIAVIQQFSSDDQLYLKKIIEDLFNRLTQPPVENQNQLLQEITKLQAENKKYQEENENLRSTLNSKEKSSRNKGVHHDLLLAEEKVNELDVMVQKQSSIISDLTSKLQHQANVQQVNQN